MAVCWLIAVYWLIAVHQLPNPTTVIPTERSDEGSQAYFWQPSWVLGANRPWPYPCDRSHGCYYFQRSHNSLTLRQVLSFSENNSTHKRALIDRKGMARVYLNYCSTVIDFLGAVVFIGSRLFIH